MSTRRDRAGFWLRVAGFLLDALIVGVPVNVVLLVVGANSVITQIAVGAAFLAYSAFFIGGPDGQTLGMKVVGIRAIAESGGHVGYARAALRYFVSLVSGWACLIGYLWMLWDLDRQTWQDKAARTLVVRARARPLTSETAVSPREPRFLEDRFPSAPSEELLLQVRDVATYFQTPRGVVHAVDGISFNLDRGRTIGIVGESGSGKTVLARSIMGLLPKNGVIRSGSIKFEGREIGNLAPDEMRHIWGSQMAMIFQDPMTSLNPVMKVGKQVTESLLYHLDISRHYASELAEALFTSVGIPEPERRLNEYPHQLSGGLRQRVMIAIALACGPKLLFADEPTTALDVTVQAQILDLLQQQQRERFMAMILVTHDLGVVAGRTDEIAVMYAGKIVEKAPTSVLFRNMKMPYTEALMQAIPKIADKSHTRLRVISGRPPQLVNPPVGCRFAPRCPYAQEKCVNEEPPLRESDVPGHLFACWFPVGTPEGRAALERNRAAGLPSAVTANGEVSGPVQPATGV